MSESLGDKRRRFTLAYARLVIWTFDQGLALTDEEGKRSDEQAEINAIGPEGRAQLVRYLQPHYPELARKIANNTGSGIRNTLHEAGVAKDASLFVMTHDRTWRWLDKGTEPEWMLVGKHWESMGPDHCWGGRFGDANHFSILHEGRK